MENVEEVFYLVVLGNLVVKNVDWNAEEIQGEVNLLENHVMNAGEYSEEVVAKYGKKLSKYFLLVVQSLFHFL